MTRRKKLKRKNGTGGVVYLGKNRRNPYGARIFDGYNENGNMKYKYIGYADSYDNAYDLLRDYNNNPYDLDYKNITFEHIYNIIQPKMEQEVGNKGMSLSNYKNITNAWNNHLQELYTKNILEIKKRDLQYIIDNNNSSKTIKNYIRNILSRIYTYSIEELELPITNNLALGLKIASTKPKIIHKALTPEEIEKVLNSDKNIFIDGFKISIYTGIRPLELVTIKNENVFLEENYMIGGCKTEAGTNRIIPIHPEIKDIIKKYYNPENEYLMFNPITQRTLTTDNYERSIKKIFNSLNIKHTPYDTRHTFGTYTKMCGINEVDRKFLMGHSQSDITNSVYTHLTPEYLLNEVKKLSYKNI